MEIIKPPQKLPLADARMLFLAGSIEMGTAEHWQTKVQERLIDTDWTILNPRRDSWDASWEQRKDNPHFREQVEWELTGLERAFRVILYLDPKTKSPISLLELGLFGRESGKWIVICPEGFWRKGNVDIVCERYGITQATTIEEAVSLL